MLSLTPLALPLALAFSTLLLGLAAAARARRPVIGGVAPRPPGATSQSDQFAHWASWRLSAPFFWPPPFFPFPSPFRPFLPFSPLNFLGGGGGGGSAVTVSSSRRVGGPFLAKAGKDPRQADRL